MADFPLQRSRAILSYLITRQQNVGSIHPEKVTILREGQHFSLTDMLFSFFYEFI
jgi:hypothetical protein